MTSFGFMFLWIYWVVEPPFCLSGSRSFLGCWWPQPVGSFLSMMWTRRTEASACWSKNTGKAVTWMDLTGTSAGILNHFTVDHLLYSSPRRVLGDAVVLCVKSFFVPTPVDCSVLMTTKVTNQILRGQMTRSPSFPLMLLRLLYQHLDRSLPPWLVRLRVLWTSTLLQVIN